MSLSTRKNYLASILVGLSPQGRGKYEKGYEKVAKQYTDYLTSQAKEYENQIIEQKKSAKQQGKWVSKEALDKVRKTYANAIKKLGYTQKSKEFRKGKEKRHQELIQKYLVASLYLLHPPRRNSYANMKIISNSAFNKLPNGEKDDNNYLVVVSRNNKFFSFGDYKTKKQYGVQKITVDKGLNSVLNLWTNFNDSEHLLLDSRGNKMTTNGLTKFLYKVFEPTGKKISSTMIRHIVLTDKYGDESGYKEKLETAKAMGHSVEEQQKTYVKKE
tara:strand:- start:262 stop:1077 length:816 start_codon:yes stop_codon:yes gene_type:complete